MSRKTDLIHSIKLVGDASSYPASPFVGEKYYDTTLQKLFIYSSYGWTAVNKSGLPIAPTVTSGTLQSWFDPSVTSTITMSGNLISQLNDLSGNNRHLYQATSANQPSYVSAYKNGKGVVQFAGSHWLRQTTTWTPTDPITMFVVGSDTAASNVNSIWTGWTNYRLDMQVTDINHAQVQVEGGNISVAYASGPALHGAGFKYITLVRPANTSSGFTFNVNGSLIATTTNGGTDAAMGAGVFSYGTRSDNAVPMSGYLGEVLLYNGALNSTDIATVQSYLASKWGI